MILRAANLFHFSLKNTPGSINSLSRPIDLGAWHPLLNHKIILKQGKSSRAL
jgi:hypothetical protein